MTEEKSLDQDIFQLSCNALTNTIEWRDIFNNSLKIQTLLNFIAKTREVGEGNVFLDKGCVYDLLYNIDTAPTNRVYDIKKPHTEIWFLPDSNLYESNAVFDCNDLLTELKIKRKGKKNNASTLNEQLEKGGFPNIEPLTRGLALALMSHPYFKKYYLVATIHGLKGDTEIQNPYVYDGKKSNIYYVFGSEFQGEKSLVVNIKDLEWKAREQNKSLILLTGSMLRLGVSLPCADIAFNFDNTTSVDLNYQTMFRVLTERPGKKYGIYVDFNPKRTISFIYDFYEQYKGGLKTIKSSPEERLEDIRDLVITDFNINGINLQRLRLSGLDQYIKLYENLMQKLDLESVNSYLQHQNEISKSLETLLMKSNTSYLTELSVVLSKKLSKTQLKMLVKGKKTKKGKKPKPLKAEDVMEEEDDDEEKLGDLGEEISMSLIQKLKFVLPDIIHLLAMFSDEKIYNCNNILSCLDNAIKRIEDFESSGIKLCNQCEIDPNDSNMKTNFYKLSILANKLKIFSDFPASQNPFCNPYVLISTLITIKNFLNAPENVEILNKLNLSYDNVRTTLGKKGLDMLISQMTPEEILSTIQKYLPVRVEEKDKYGEVFTPASLIEEMFDKLPKHVWSDPDSKWLDPANGIGNFPMLAYIRLMEGLKSKIPDPKKRSEHIIKEMLYMVELNEKNVAVSRKIFGPNANIFCGSFLSDDKKSVNSKVLEAFGIDKFDVIMGNPPFNAEGRVNTGNTLWPYFVKISIDLLKSNGYLVFVHPAGWRKPESDKSKTKGLFRLMAHENSLLYLEIHDTSDGHKVFNAGTRYDWYVLQKKPNRSDTLILDQMGKSYKVNLNDFEFLPNFDINEIKKILKKPSDIGVPLIPRSYQFETRRKWTSENKSEKFKYPLVHSTPKSGPRFYWSSTMEPPVKNPVPMFGVKKVIFGDAGINDVIIDMNTENHGKGFGMTEHAIGIKVSSEREAKHIKKALESEKFEKILEALSFSNFLIDWHMFTYFKPDFYKYFLSTADDSAGQSKPKKKNTRRKKHRKHGKRKTRRRK